MDTHVEISHTVKEQIWDVRYCDKCKEPIDMNKLVGDRPHATDVRYTHYCIVRDYSIDPSLNDGISSYCECCMYDAIKDVLNTLEGQYEIAMQCGIVYPDELTKRKDAGEKRKQQRDAAFVKTLTGLAAEEEERYQRLMGSDNPVADSIVSGEKRYINKIGRYSKAEDPEFYKQHCHSS